MLSEDSTGDAERTCRGNAQMFRGEELTWKMTDIIDETVPGMHEYLELTRRCVSEDPTQRPDFNKIGSQLRILLYNTARSKIGSPQRSLGLSPHSSHGTAISKTTCKTLLSQMIKLLVCRNSCELRYSNRSWIKERLVLVA